MSETRRITVSVNGRRHEADVDVRLTLADFLRHQLDLTGTHVGCEHGVCGACTILVDGRSARSCLMLAVQTDEFLRDNPDPTEDDVRIAISGNLCRCTGYQGIVAAVLDAAKRMKAEGRA
jgi:carbon-monoxide dehydrogenase small subunit